MYMVLVVLQGMPILPKYKYNVKGSQSQLTLVFDSLIPKPSPSFLLIAVRQSGRAPGTFPHVSDVMGRNSVLPTVL